MHPRSSPRVNNVFGDTFNDGEWKLGNIIMNIINIKIIYRHYCINELPCLPRRLLSVALNLHQSLKSQLKKANSQEKFTINYAIQ